MNAVPVGFGFGSNIGDKAGHIREAVATLEREGVASDVRCSSLYRTAPWGSVQDQDWFVNACATGDTSLSPSDLLAHCKDIERRLGRTATVRWGPRVIDIDILFYGDLALKTPGLILPHKELMRRAFVLVPLAEIAPDLSIGGVEVQAAITSLGDQGVKKLAPWTE